MVTKTKIDIVCTRCGSVNYIKSGWGWRKGKKNVQQYRCRDCGKIFRLPDGMTKEVKK